jgi:hypothetical protein
MPDPEPTDAAMQRLTAYWLAHPLAADTLQGICRWWIADAAIAPAQVEAALARLVAMGLVEASQAADGRVRYRLRQAGAAPG